MFLFYKRKITVMFAVFFVAITMLCAAPVQAEKLRMLVWEGYAPDKWVEKYKDLVKEKYKVDLEVEVKFVTSNDQFIDALKGGSVDIISPSHNLPKDPRYKYIAGKLTLPH